MGQPQELPASENAPTIGTSKKPTILPFLYRDREEVLEERRLKLRMTMTRDQIWEANKLKQSRKNAKAALTLYNEREGVNYKLEDDNSSLRSNVIFEFSAGECFLHGNFRAKIDDGSGKIHPSELFFGETRFKKDGFGMIPVSCCIIKTADIDDKKKIRKGCGYCGQRILHPVGEYKYGMYNTRYKRPVDDDEPSVAPPGSP